MAKVYVAFFWHHHQPYYTDDISGDTPLPWVRLHAIKDYIGMALLLDEFPQVRCTFNFVPSLLRQLLDVGSGRVQDRYFVLSRKDPAHFDRYEREFVLKYFFSANWDNMIKPYPRFAELLAKRGFGARDFERSREKFSHQELRDLQVYFNLVWFHPLIVEKDKFLQHLHAKKRDFTEPEKHLLLDKQLEVVRSVIGAYRKLAESGRIELTASPFYHPILPLLYDMRNAHDGLPNAALPANRVSLAEDAEVHLDRGLALHAEMFGAPPRGMWPPEGSVSSDIIEPLAARGIRWIATDEDILAASQGQWLPRDSTNRLKDPERLYKPYIAARGDKAVSIIFRDRVLSNAVSFDYQKTSAAAAAEDFVSYMRTLAGRLWKNPPIVPVILDGENAWEYYAGGGVPFLRELYGRLSREKDVETVRVSEYLDLYPPKEVLPKLYSGSWINGNFYTWIGHREDVEAWQMLFAAREAIVQAEKTGRVGQDALKSAREELYIAEGSDWFWWYGDDHSSEHDDIFDALFRTHIGNIYRLLNLEPPPELATPIKKPRDRTEFEEPNGLLKISLDGRVSSFFEWLGAGRYDNRRAQGAMEKTVYYVTVAHFGFDKVNFYLRLDFSSLGRTWTADGLEIRVVFTEPTECTLAVRPDEKGGVKLFVYHKDDADPRYMLTSARMQSVLELSCPFDILRAAPGQKMVFHVEVANSRHVLERIPLGSPLYFETPSENFEEEVWL